MGNALNLHEQASQAVWSWLSTQMPSRCQEPEDMFLAAYLWFRVYHGVVPDLLPFLIGFESLQGARLS